MIASLAFLVALAAGATTAAVVCRAVNLRITVELLLAPVSVALLWLSVKLCDADVWPISGGALGFLLTVLIAKARARKRTSSPVELHPDTLNQVWGRGKE